MSKNIMLLELHVDHFISALELDFMCKTPERTATTFHFDSF